MFADQGRNLFILVVIVFLGWFALGTQLNVRRGNAVLRWLQGGLQLVGEKATLRWLGSSAVELKVQNALSPLRSAEIFIVLEPRDIPFLWWFFRARGRRDLLIVRGQLRDMPRFEFEALDTRAWSTRGMERELKSRRWTPLETPPGARLAAYTHGRTKAGAELLRELLADSVRDAVQREMPLVRLAVRQDMPNLEVQWRLAGFERFSPLRLFEKLHRIAERL